MPQATFAANNAADNTDRSSTAQAVEQEAPQPVGGCSPPEIRFVNDEPEVDNASDLPTFKRSIINAEPDSVFTKGASTVGYDSLATDGQRNYYEALNDEAIAFMNAKEDLKATQLSTASGSVDVYAIAKLDFAQYGITDFEEASRAYYAYYYDHPAYYWISNTVWSTSSSFYLSTDEEYASVDERARINSMVDDGVKNYVALAEHGADTLDKIAMIHDQILTDADYAYGSDGKTPVSARWAHSVQGLFDQDYRKVVCEGYANAFSLIMNYMDIPNYYIIGMAGYGGAGGGGVHAWNAVSANDGKSYLYMDLTWDDLGSAGYFNKYFGMPSSDFEKTHSKYVPENTGSKWLYPITGNINDDFAGTYYNQGDLYYDGQGAAANDIVVKGRTRAARIGTHASFITSSKDRLKTVASSLGKVSYSYYTASYKGTDYYLIISPISDLWIDLSEAELALDRSSYLYTGDPIEPKPVVTCNGVVLIEDTDYTLSYENNTEANANASVTATGNGNFEGSASKAFIIDPHNHSWGTPQYNWASDYNTVTAVRACQLEGCTVKPETETANTTSEITRNATCTEAGTRTYTATFKSQAFATQTKDVTIEALGHEWDEGVVTTEPTYTSVGVRTFTCKHDPTHTMTEEIPMLTPEPITPKGTTITKLLKGKNRMTVKWKKQPVQTTGYQIRYSLKKNFSSGVKTVTIKSAKTTKKEIKKLKAKKTYYVQIRTYVKISDQNYYSAWSKTKSVKTN